MRVLIESIASVDEKDLEQKPQYITPERWEKILRIRPVEDKKRSLLAGRLLYRMCRECGVTDPEYGTVKSGKPVLVNRSGLAFSVSHSGEYVVVAYTQKASSIGADIQQIKSMSDGLKKRLLNENEVLWLEKKLSSKEREDAMDETLYLNRLWAIKEGFVKMTGEGLSHDFRKLYVDMGEKIVRDENGCTASFVEQEAPRGYVMAIITEK